MGDVPLTGSVSIGRNPSSTIQLVQPNVSGCHAKIYRRDEGWLVQDQNSTNGTLVNGSYVYEQWLQDGDWIGVGDCTLVFRAPTAPEDKYMRSERTINLRGDDAEALRFASEHPNALQHHVVRPPVAQRVGASIASFFPVFGWLRQYSGDKAIKDLFAGLTVAAMLVPQGMAYSMLAGMPPIHGLYASIIPLIAYAFMGTSRQLSAGPTALDSLLVAAGVGAMAPLGEPSYIELVVLLSLIVGGLQIAMGLARLGFLVNFLSQPVMTGFGAAAAIIIALSQLKHLLGISLPQSNAPHVVLSALAERISTVNLPTLGLGLFCFILITMIKKVKKRRLPGALIAVVVSTLLVWMFSLQQFGVKTVGVVPSGLPTPGMPAIRLETLEALLPVALTVAFVSFMEVISVSKLYASKNGYRVDANQELIAIGTANVAGGLFRAFPISGGISRSAVNAAAGAQTQIASVIAALLVALALTLLTPLFYHLPNAVLAAIILSAVRGLIDVKQMKYLFRVRKTEGMLLVVTLGTTLAWNITFGLLTGVVASILLFIALNSRPHIAALGRIPGTQIFRNVENFAEAEQLRDLLMLRIDASLYFANTEFLKDRLTAIAEQPVPPRAVILDASAVNDLDSSADTALQEIVQEYERRKIGFYIAGVKAPVRAVMKRSGLYDLIGAQRFFYTMEAAVQRFESTRSARGHTLPA